MKPPLFTGILRAAVGFGLLFLFPLLASAEAPGGIGLAIVYDTSGSMRDPVADATGKPAPKYLIANRALLDVMKKLESFHQANPNRPLRTSLVIFAGNGAKEVVPFGDFDEQRFVTWVKSFSRPEGPTPLGQAIRTAAQPLIKSDLKHKHILVVTDGENTAGPNPAAVIPALRASVTQAGGNLGIHFVAFDVAAKVFDPVKKLNATVVSAANEKELDTQLSIVLEQKVLLEDEDPPRPKS